MKTVLSLLLASSMCTSAIAETLHNVLPHIENREYWTQMPKERAENIIAQADKILAEQIPEVCIYDYMRGGIDGNRSVYEEQNFSRRNNLLILFLAYCYTGDKDKYFIKIVNYVGAIYSEPIWCIYPHANPLPNDCWVDDSTEKKADLFSCATAANISIVMNVLEKDFKQLSPALYEKIRQSTIHKVLDSTIGPEKFPYWWFDEKTWAENWTPWCICNLLVTVLEFGDKQMLENLLERAMPAIKVYFDCYSDEGFCSEGASYWEVANFTFLDFLLLLDKVAPELARPYLDSPKFRRLGEYIAQMKVNQDYIACYADNHAKTQPEAAPLYRFGQTVHSELMMNYASHIARQTPTDTLPEHMHYMPYTKILNLMTVVPTTAEFTLPDTTYYTNHLAIMRNKTSFSATLKTGNNEELHNHNDLGHFAVFYGNTPIVIDAGTERYTIKNFNAERYNLWYTSAKGHNAPIINGYGQIRGPKYTATLAPLINDNGVFSTASNLKHAYPDELKLQDFERKIKVAPDAVTVEDEITIEKLDSISIRLYSILPITIKQDKIYFGTTVYMTLSGLNPGNINVIEVDERMTHNYAKQIYCIELKGTQNKYKINFSSR